jgi:hypothetical protein
MEGSPLEAIAYIKGHVPAHDPAPIVQLDDENSPVLKNLGGGLLVAYLMDQGDRFAYVQRRHLRAAGIDTDELHARAVANLCKLAEGRVTIRQNGPTCAGQASAGPPASIGQRSC